MVSERTARYGSVTVIPDAAHRADAPAHPRPLELDRIVVTRAGRNILDDVTLHVEADQHWLVLGANGSGKTTLLRIVSTLLRPTRGTAEVAGLDSVRDAGRIRPLVGLLGHNTALYDHLTASENLVFSVRMAGVREDPAAITDALQRVRLIGSSTERVRGFSAGMRRRLGLARLLLRPPTVLLLDEPYASFDEDGIDLVNGFATDVASRGGLVLLATHDLTRAEDIMTRRIHIENGRLIELRDTAPLHAGVAL